MLVCTAVIIQVSVLIIYRLLLITCMFCHASMSDAAISIELFLKRLQVSQDTFCLTNNIINVVKMSPKVFT